jgi:hypothetical protein
LAVKKKDNKIKTQDDMKEGIMDSGYVLLQMEMDFLD